MADSAATAPVMQQALPEGYTIEGGSTPPAAPMVTSAPQGTVSQGLPAGYTVEGTSTVPPVDTSTPTTQPTGLWDKIMNAISGDSGTPSGDTNIGGHHVIVPMPGESFADTLKRGAQAGKSVTPEQASQEISDVGIGAMKSVGQTAMTLGQLGSDVGTLGIDRLVEPKSVTDQKAKVNKALEPSNYDQQTGQALETVLEFYAGDEALKGLSLSEKFAQVGKIGKFMEAYPRLANILADAIRGGTVGGVVGGAHGGTKGAIEGAAGGALITGGASAVGEGVGAMMKPAQEAGGAGIPSATHSVEAPETPVGKALENTAVKSGLPEGNYPVTADDIATATRGLGEGPMVDTTIRGTMEEVAADHGLGPKPDTSVRQMADNPELDVAAPENTTSIRDAVKDTGDKVMAKSKAAYQQLDEASGGRWQRFDDQIKNLNDKMDEVNGIDDDKFAQYEQKRNEIETSQAQMVEDLKTGGKIDPKLADQALSDYKQAQALYDLDKAVKASTNGRMGMGAGGEAVDSAKLTNRLHKLYDSGRLQQAVGADRAKNLLSTSQGVFDEGTKIANLQPHSATGQQAMKELLRPATTENKFWGVKQDFVQGWKNFNKLTAEEQLAKFPGPGEAAKARDFLRGKARMQVGKKVAAGLTLGAIAHKAGLDKVILHAIMD